MHDRKQVRRAVVKDQALEAYETLMEATGITLISDAIAYTSKFIPMIISHLSTENRLSNINQTIHTIETPKTPEIIKIDCNVPVEF